MQPSFARLASADSSNSEDARNDVHGGSQGISSDAPKRMRLDCVLVNHPPHKRRQTDTRAGSADIMDAERPSDAPPSVSSVKRRRTSRTNRMSNNSHIRPTASGLTVGPINATSPFGLFTPTSTATAQRASNNASTSIRKVIAPASLAVSIVCGTCPDSEGVTSAGEVKNSSSQAAPLRSSKSSCDAPQKQPLPNPSSVPAPTEPGDADPSPVNFELLDTLDLPSWVSTNVPLCEDSDAVSERRRELYLPPGLSNILTAMQHTLNSERAARLRAETLYEQETRLRAAAQRDAEREAALRAQAERDAAQLRIENAQIRQRHTDWISATSTTLVENLTQFSEQLIAEAVVLSLAPSDSPTTRGSGPTVTGAAVNSMAVD